MRLQGRERERGSFVVFTLLFYATTLLTAANDVPSCFRKPSTPAQNRNSMVHFSGEWETKTGEDYSARDF
uniref:Secreted protein n=1 Tax=Anopheles darlingi TaxID=43151 RepID=A0A2M4DL55_ANODA